MARGPIYLIQKQKADSDQLTRKPLLLSLEPESFLQECHGMEDIAVAEGRAKRKGEGREKEVRCGEGNERREEGGLPDGGWQPRA